MIVMPILTVTALSTINWEKSNALCDDNEDVDDDNDDVVVAENMYDL